MDIFSAIENRYSCRSFLPAPVSDDQINRILEAAVRAPSPLNTQPWQFVVIRSEAKKKDIFGEAERCRRWAIEKSGWKWLEGYQTDFLLQAPVLIAVVGDPAGTGVDQFQAEGNMGFALACAAAIQNMLLAAHALGLGSLFYTMFDKPNLRAILDVPPEKTPLALVCVGTPGEIQKPVPRKNITKKTSYLT